MPLKTSQLIACDTAFYAIMILIAFALFFAYWDKMSCKNFTGGGGGGGGGGGQRFNLTSMILSKEIPKFVPIGFPIAESFGIPLAESFGFSLAA